MHDHLHFAREQRDDRRRIAPERHMRHARAHRLVEEKAGEMRHRRRSRRCIVELPLVRFRVSGEFRISLRRRGGTDDEQVRRFGDHGHRGQRLQRVVAHPLVQELVDDEVVGRPEEQRIAVGRRLHDLAHADEARAAGAEIEHHALAEALLQAALDRAEDDVAAAAGRIGQHHADRFLGVRSERRLCGKREN